MVGVGEGPGEVRDAGRNIGSGVAGLLHLLRRNGPTTDLAVPAPLLRQLCGGVVSDTSRASVTPTDSLRIRIAGKRIVRTFLVLRSRFSFVASLFSLALSLRFVFLLFVSRFGFSLPPLSFYRLERERTCPLCREIVPTTNPIPKALRDGRTAIFPQLL